jgi:hypothetical protein
MPIYIDESGGLPAGGMIMAGVEIEADSADQLLLRFRAVTGLSGELKGSRIEPIERAFFFELFERFGGRARVCIARDERGLAGQRPEDLDVYVALLDLLVDDWLAGGAECPNFVIDQGRYDALVLEEVRQDIARLLAHCGTASLVDSRRSAGVQIADVIANSFYNVIVGSRQSSRVETIVEPFLRADLIRVHHLATLPPPKRKHPALQGNAGRPVILR